MKEAAGVQTRRSLFPMFAVLCASCALIFGPDLRRSKTQAATVVGYCELLRKPASFHGVNVTVSGTYRHGFEWSEIYCLSCLDLGRTWVDFDESASTSHLTRRLLTGTDLGRTANVVFSGILEGPGNYGH